MSFHSTEDSILPQRYPRRLHPENDNMERSLFMKAPHIVRCIKDKGETFKQLYQNFREFNTISWGLSTDRCPTNFEMLQGITLEYEPRNDTRGDLGMAIKFFRIKMNVARAQKEYFQPPSIHDFWQVVRKYPDVNQKYDYKQSDAHLKDREMIICLISNAPIANIVEIGEFLKKDVLCCNPELYDVMKSEPDEFKRLMSNQRLHYTCTGLSHFHWVQNDDRATGVQWLKNQGYKPHMPRWIAKKMQDSSELAPYKDM